MKKFYEKPVVEITKFAFEDIMTKSVVTVVADDTINADAIINEIEAKAAGATQAKRFGLYKW